jgi:peptide-methionine (S)-S-oxide reductase
MNMKPLLVVTALVGAVVFGPALLSSRVAAGDLRKEIPAAVADPANPAKSEIAVLAGGCFWGQQGVFEHVKGVTKVVAGYSGGARETATYEQVGGETTGHAESVQITFDPKVVTFGQLLRIYFSVAHDPTQRDGQGPDEGPSYRSEVFAASPTQEATAKSYIAQLGTTHVFATPIVTKVETLKGFYPAEDYHQDYLAHNPNAAYIRVNDMPKIAALRQVWPQYYRADPVLLARD